MIHSILSEFTDLTLVGYCGVLIGVALLYDAARARRTRARRESRGRATGAWFNLP